MANVVFLFDGTDSTQDLALLSAADTLGTVVSATDQVRTGPRSLKMTYAGSVAQASFRGVLADAGRRCSFALRLSQVTTTPWALRFRNTSDQNVCVISVNSSVFTLAPTGATSVVGSVTLSANAWYRVVVAFTITNTTTFKFVVMIYDSADTLLETLTATAGTLTRTGADRFNMTVPSISTNPTSMWFDDLFIDDGADYLDPGNIRVTNKRPAANGTTNGFTTQIGSGGSGYGSGHAPQVNEQPLSTTNGWSMVGAGAAVTEEYTIESAAAGDLDISADYDIVGKMGWVYAKSLASETGSIVTDGLTSSISLTSTDTLFKKPVTSTSYPAGGTDVGIITDTTLTTVSLFEAGVLFAVRQRTLLFAVESLAAAISEAPDVRAIIAVSESLAVRASLEAAFVLAALDVIDALRLVLSEQAFPYVSADGRDTLGSTVAEQSFPYTSSDVADAITAASSERSFPYVSVDGADATVVVLTEIAEVFTGQATVDVTATDALLVVVAETVALLVTVDGADGAGARLSELAELLISVAAQDSGRVAGSETTDIAVILAVAEAARVALAESPDAILAQASPSDNQSLGAGEEVDLSVSVSSSDATGLGLADLAFLTVLVEVAEALALSLVESAAITVALFALDACAVVLAEVSGTDVVTVEFPPTSTRGPAFGPRNRDETVRPSIVPARKSMIW